MNQSAVMLAVVVLLCIAFGALIRRLFARVDAPDSVTEWLQGFTLEAYRPMERLLNDCDYEFLAAQPGFHDGIVRELRAERKKIFRAYLRQMSADFHKLLRVANLMLVYSAEDRPDLASALWRIRLRFYWNLAYTEVLLAAYPSPLGSISPANLISAMEGLQYRVLALAPANPEL